MRIYSKVTKQYVNAYKEAHITKYDFPKAFSELIKTLSSNSRVLDIGIGGGTITKYCHHLNGNVHYYGIDLVKSDYLPKFAKFKRCSADKIAFPSDYFNVIICSQLLEHVLYPQKTIAEIKRVLKRKGIGIIAVPYYRTLFLPDGLSNFYCDYTHVRPFTKYSLRKLLTDYNVKVKYLKVWRNPLTLLITPYLLLKSIYDKSAFDTAIRTIIGSNLICIFEKE